jgi:hypothetical protein
MGALSDHYRRKVGSASSTRLNEQDRSATASSAGGGRAIAPHLLMLVAAVLIGGALGLAYQHLNQAHPGVNKGKHVRVKPAEMKLAGSEGAELLGGDVEVPETVWDVSSDRGVLGAGLFGSSRGVAAEEQGSLQQQGGRKERSDATDRKSAGEISVNLAGGSSAGEVTRLVAAAEGTGSVSVGRGSASSGDVVERTYVQQPGEIVAEDEEGGKFVVDDKDRIVYVEKEGAERLLRGLIARRGRLVKGGAARKD